jgi:hypothetical protein
MDTYLGVSDGTPASSPQVSEGDVLAGAYRLGPKAGEWMSQTTLATPSP